MTSTDKIINTYPLFEKGSPSALYQQINNFSVNYTEGLLISVMHLEIDDSFSESIDTYKKLQKKLQKRERTIRHAFQFQIEKLFSDFKTVRKTRLHANRASDWLALGLTGQNASKVRLSIENTSDHLNTRFDRQLQNINERLKTLVHRSDTTRKENPLTPENLCNAFLTCIEALSFTSKQLCQLIDLYERVLSLFLEDFYRQLDLGMYYLDILPELTDPSLFKPKPVTETSKEIIPLFKDEIVANPQLEARSISSDKSSGKAASPAPPEEKRALSVVREVKPIPEKEEKKSPLDLHMEELFRLTSTGTLDYAVVFASFLHSTKSIFSHREQSEVFRFLNFYTHLLDNPKISDAMKIQLSRLSQPLVKLVQFDPFFFRSSTHPVNDFLQSIIDYEIRYAKISPPAALLSGLLDKFLAVNDITLDDFSSIIEDFENLKNSETTKLRERKQTTQQQENKIKKRVLDLINEITESLLVDQEVAEFFYNDWQLLLIQVASKIGVGSQPFEQAVEIAQLLAWSLNEKREDNPEFARHNFTTILKAIDKGLNALNFSSSHRTRVRKLLVQEFKKVSHPETQIVVSSSKPVKSSPSLYEFGDAMNRIRLNLPGTVQNTVLDDEALKNFLDSLQFGSWVEIKEDKKGRFKRGKLKWKAQDNSRFLFIDQRGHKVNESNLEQLKHIFADDMIRVLSSPSSFSSSRKRLGHGYHDYLK